MRLSRQPIIIDCLFGPKEIHALVTGGLAVHRYEGRWRVTHVRSGRVVRYATSRAQAYTLLRRLLLMTDWTRTSTALQRDRRLKERLGTAIALGKAGQRR